MSREIVMAAISALATIGLAWAIDHPAKVGGSAIILVVFVIIAIVARARASRAPDRSARLRPSRKPSDPTGS